jgi:hypothetical protein
VNEFDLYEFWLDAYTPESMPMERLAKYMAALAKMLGSTSSVHFERLERGSTRNILRVDRHDAPKVFQRIEQLGGAAAANDVVAAFDEINLLLRNDDAVGRLSRVAGGESESAIVLQFLGRDLPRQTKFGPFAEPAVIDGELVRIGGKDATAHAWVVDSEGKIWNGEISRSLAAEIAQYLYKGPLLRLHGDAKWERQEDGAWSASNFRISSYEVLRDDTLEDATTRLRSLKATDWAAMDDIDGFIAVERGESDGLH